MSEERLKELRREAAECDWAISPKDHIACLDEIAHQRREAKRLTDQYEQICQICGLHPDTEHEDRKSVV